MRQPTSMPCCASPCAALTGCLCTSLRQACKSPELWLQAQQTHNKLCLWLRAPALECNPQAMC